MQGSPGRRRPGGAAGVLAAALALASLAPGASAATIDVTYHGDSNNNNTNGCGLREAIRSANEDASIGSCRKGQGGQVLDTIRVEPGSYELTIPGEDAFADAGDLDITSFMRVVGTGRGFTVDAGGEDGIDDRIFDLSGDGGASIENAKLRGGHTVGGVDGGAVRLAPDTDLRLKDVVLKGNEAADAGAFAGAIHSQGTLKMVDVKVLKSEALIVGAINSEEPAVMRRVTVRGSEAPFGGGAVRTGDDLKLLDSTISSNSVTPGNTGTHGGGGLAVVVGDTADVVVRNSTISGNNSDQDGGGIAVFQGPVRVIHSTITGNRADADALDNNGDGGGIWVDTDAAAELRATILANNFDDSILAPIHRDCSGEVGSYGFNLIRFQFGCTITDVTPEDDLDEGLEPKLKPLAANGGPTQTHALRASSPLVDLIPKAKCHEGVGVDPKRVRRDQRGIKRPQGSRCDAGAFELD